MLLRPNQLHTSRGDDQWLFVDGRIQRWSDRAFGAGRLFGRTATSDLPLVTAGEALPVRGTDLLHAATQHGAAVLDLLNEVGAGIAVADVDAALLLAGGAGEYPDGQAESAR